MKTKYQMDLKVFQTVHVEEAPLCLHDNIFRVTDSFNLIAYSSYGGLNDYSQRKRVLDPGYHSPVINVTREELDEIEDWLIATPGIKLIGLTRL